MLSYLKKIIFPDKREDLLKKVKEINENIDNSFTMIEPYSLNISVAPNCIRIDKDVHFRKFCNVIVAGVGQLYIGNKVFFNNYCSVNCLGKIEIGENTLFGEGVKIYDHNHLYSLNSNVLDVNRDEFSIGFVSIGKNCWIGSNVVILKNVIIGDNVIIGANNLIYKSIPSNVIVKQKSDFVIENL
jgi:acetyltransferase-like isoleucine patch superfamily enzyme